MSFVEHAHCPCCKTNLIIIDNKVTYCPMCELKRSKKTQNFEKKMKISQEIF